MMDIEVKTVSGSSIWQQYLAAVFGNNNALQAQRTVFKALHSFNIISI